MKKITILGSYQMTSKKYNLVIVPDNEVEEFTESKCTCPTCTEMNNSGEAWALHTPENMIQVRLAEAITRIEESEQSKGPPRKKKRKN